LLNSERISYTLSNFLLFFHKHTALSNPFRQLKCELQQIIFSSRYWENKLNERIKLQQKQINTGTGSSSGGSSSSSSNKNKFSNIEQYPVIALEIQEILFLTEKESNEIETMKRFYLNPKYCSWGGGEGGMKIDSRQTLPSMTSSNAAPSSSSSPTDGPGANAVCSGSIMTKKRRELQRGTSHDDMLDATTGKLHKQPSVSGTGTAATSGRVKLLQQQKTQKQLTQIGALMDVYNPTSSSQANLPKIRRSSCGEDETTADNGAGAAGELPKIKPRNSSSIDKSASAESHPIISPPSLLSHANCPSIRGLATSKQPSSTNLLPSMSRKGGSMTSSPTSPHGPLARGPSAARFQPLVQPKGVTAAAAQRKLLRKYSSDDMLR
jgi:hypothetical protein